MKKRVKITTLEWLLDLIYPCYCKGCGKSGTIFCSRCFFDNMAKNRPFFSEKDKDFHNIFVCGERIGVLSDLISQYKFLSRRHYRKVLVKYLETTLKEFSKGEKYVLVPLPTISKHIRERGFDHIGLLCEELSDVMGFPVLRALLRKNSSVQVGAGEKERKEQAKEAYLINSKVKLDKKSHFLLVDDVWTTGASMRAARSVLEAELIKLGAKKKEIKISAICLAKNGGYEF